MCKGTEYAWLRQGRPLPSLYGILMCRADFLNSKCGAGFSNEFLVNSAADLAVEYNDASVNENMHAATAFKIFLKPHNNFLTHLSDSHYRFFRRTVISIVLSTDMAAHTDLVNVRICFLDHAFTSGELRCALYTSQCIQRSPGC